jgi:hypothetical protein
MQGPHVAPLAALDGPSKAFGPVLMVWSTLRG